MDYKNSLSETTAAVAVTEQDIQERIKAARVAANILFGAYGPMGGHLKVILDEYQTDDKSLHEVEDYLTGLPLSHDPIEIAHRHFGHALIVLMHAIPNDRRVEVTRPGAP